MPRSNLTGGKHHKKGKKRKPNTTQNLDNRVESAGDTQVYALVKSKPGGSRLRVECSDGKERSASIPGKFFKKLWMNVGDIILCDLNVGSDDSLCYVVHKYTNKDASVLKSQGKISFDILEDKEENNSFKFVEKNTIPEQKRVLDLNNIDDSISDSFDSNELDNLGNVSNDKQNKSEDDSIDLDDI